MHIQRPRLSTQLSSLLNSFRAVELVGPRQVGKTTLARQFIDFGSPRYFDLEDPVSRQRLADPMNTLAGLDGLVVIDEVQHLPALPETLRVLMDQPAAADELGPSGMDEPNVEALVERIRRHHPAFQSLQMGWM